LLASVPKWLQPGNAFAIIDVLKYRVTLCAVNGWNLRRADDACDMLLRSARGIMIVDLMNSRLARNTIPQLLPAKHVVN